MSSPVYYAALCVLCVMVLKEFNSVVAEPYMDEPFHIPQAQAYCRKEWDVWDPKITTPPGLYVLTYLLKTVFMFKCTTSLLRLTSTIFFLTLQPILTRLLSYHQRLNPPRDILTCSLESIVVSVFPVAWFFGFLYYTDIGSLALVMGSFVASAQEQHALSALLGLLSCTFRQTNIIWMLYSFAYNQLVILRFRRDPPGATPSAKLHDPPALEAAPSDLLQSALSFPKVLPGLLLKFLPYLFVVIAFVGFVIWNGGIVLGDKSNHIPTIHVPQLFYFIGFATLLGWPALLLGEGGVIKLFKDVKSRMIGGRREIAVSVLLTTCILASIHYFTIHHPFLLSDNRHYTFYVWKRIFRVHPVAPYVFAPAYLACAWAWFLRVGAQQTILQTILLPLVLLPTLLPTPLLEPRYFLIPYFFLRAQVVDMSSTAVTVEGLWYMIVNAATMYVFLYCSREDGAIRFMW